MISSMLANTILGTWLLVSGIWGVEAAPRNADIHDERVGTASQTAIRQAAPIIAPIAVEVDGKIILSNTTGVDIGGPPWRNSPPQQSDPAPARTDIGTVVRASIATLVTVPHPISVAVTPSPIISTSVVSVVPPQSSSSTTALPPLQTVPSVIPVPAISSSSISVATILSSSFVVAPPPSQSSAVLIHPSVSSTIITSPISTGPTTIKSTILVFARDTASGYSAYSGLNAIGIPYQLVIVPQAGITLPVLNTSSTAGNYGGIVILSEVSYNYGASLGFQSALSAAQWASLYQYQSDFGVYMVRMDAFPGPAFGTRALGGCCNSTVEQLISISDISKFPGSGLQVGAGLSTTGLWHYPANITDSTIAIEFAQFAPAASSGYPNFSTAGVINNIDGRQQMVFFINFASDWSYTSVLLQHAWISWLTRGLYAGYRRINLNTQVDDMFLDTDIYSPNGTTYQVTTDDLDEHIDWMKDINANRLTPGSDYFIEVGHNGNGNIEDAASNDPRELCTEVGEIQLSQPNQVVLTPLEFVKPLGTGTNQWPSTPATFNWTTKCSNLDALYQWWTVPTNLNSYAHISHTFTHELEDNATYFDVYREITFNQAWLNQSKISGATMFSFNGIIPPAITGLHNGDAIRAWHDAGIRNVVGDNTRPSLMNSQNEMWPLMSTVEANGFAGMQISGRWATNIYYNCQLPDCCVLEWIATSAGKGNYSDMLELETRTNVRHLLGLHHDAFMFHQANLNYVTAPLMTVNGNEDTFSLLQVWVETITAELSRLVTWPIISQKQDDFAAGFMNRMTRDQCSPSLEWAINPIAKNITGVTLTTTNNTCAASIPVTFPGSVTNTQGFTAEQIGTDPLTLWVNMNGAPVTFTFTTPVAL
ncbi:hypothetical protein V8E51_012766 [Hyaloscypha variabilis]